MQNSNIKVQQKIDLSHLAWLLSFISLFSLIIKTPGEIQELNAGNIARIVSIIASGILSIWCILFRKGTLIKIFQGPQKWLLMYGIIALVSGAYASHGFYAIWKSIEIIVDILLVGALLSSVFVESNIEKLYKLCIGLFVVIILSVWLGALISPQKAFNHSRGLLSIQIQGIYPPINSNGLGFISAFLVVVFISKAHYNRSFLKLFAWFLVAIAGITLILAQSRTSLIGCAVAVLAYSFLTRNKAMLFVSLLGIASIVFWDAGRQFVYEYIRRGQSAELAISLSGRRISWDAALRLFSQSPWIGHGFASAGRFDVLGGGAMSTLHGSAIDVLVGVGIFGFVPWFLGVSSTVWSLGSIALRCKNAGHEIRTRRAEMFAVMVLLLIRATTSSGLALHDHAFLLFIILVALSWVWRREKGNQIVPSIANA